MYDTLRMRNFCAKCREEIKEDFWYLVICPSKFGGVDETHICERCFKIMWRVKIDPNDE